MALKYHSMMKKLALTASLLGMSVIAHADYFGAASGRSANPANTPGVSVEGFASLGSDFRVIGARTNFNVNEKLTVYGDIGITEVFLSDGLSFGGGVFYGLESIGREGSFVASLDVAIQGSLHIASLDFFGVDSHGSKRPTVNGFSTTASHYCFTSVVETPVGHCSAASVVS